MNHHFSQPEHKQCDSLQHWNSNFRAYFEKEKESFHIVCLGSVLLSFTVLLGTKNLTNGGSTQKFVNYTYIAF